MKSILSIDGGGLRGIIPLKVLEYIEEKTGKQIHELFHVIGGTSTGGIIALGLASKMPGKDRIYKAEDLLKFYTTKEDVERIFKRRWGDEKWTSEVLEEIDKGSNLKEAIENREPSYKRPGVVGPYYQKTSIGKYLQEKFGLHTKLSDLQPKSGDKMLDVTVFSYDIQNDCPYYFNSKKASENPKDDYCIWQAARATSAAPTYFPAGIFSSEPNPPVFIDGGVYINNPALALLIRAKDLFPDEENFMLISLGTGNLTVSRPNFQNAGAEDWLLGIGEGGGGGLLEVMMKGCSDTIHQQLQQLVSNRSNSRLKIPSLNRYERYQKELTESIAMDDISEQARNKLVNWGQALVNENQNELNELCKVLVNIK